MTNNPSDQMTGFDQLSNQMFLNVPIYQPDFLVLDFINKYFPQLTRKPTAGGWTIHAPLPESEFHSTIHSVVFKSHPYFETIFAHGRLDILCSERRNHLGISIDDFHLWFMFDTKQDADIPFHKLTSMFDSVSKNVQLDLFDKKRVAQYSDNSKPNDFNTVVFILTEDELAKGKYRLLFKIGSYDYAE